MRGVEPADTDRIWVGGSSGRGEEDGGDQGGYGAFAVGTGDVEGWAGVGEVWEKGEQARE